MAAMSHRSGPCGYRRVHKQPVDGGAQPAKCRPYDRARAFKCNADGSVWARSKAGKAELRPSAANIDMDSNYSQFQLGGDYLPGQRPAERYRWLCVMASYQRRYRLPPV